MKKIIKENLKLIFVSLLTGIICITGTVYAIEANQVEYKSGNLNDALDSLYCRANEQGSVQKVTASDVTATANKGNTVGTITLTKGIYVISAYASYEGVDLRYHITLDEYNMSAYDNSGFVRMNITNIVEVTDNSRDIKFQVWPNNKTITLKDVVIKAVRLY